MRRSTIFSTTLVFLIFLSTLNAADVTGTGLFGVFQVNSLNYTDQLYDYASETSARNLEYQGNGINQRSYYSFTTTGIPTYPILGSSMVIAIGAYVPVYPEPQPAGQGSAMQAPSQQTAVADTQNVMLVNQILDNSSSTTLIDWTSQTSNPASSQYMGGMYGGNYGFTANLAYVPQPEVLTAALNPLQTPALLQHDVNGQTFVNTFSADAISGGFLGTLAQVDVPEPSTAVLLGLGVGALLFGARRKRLTA